MVSYHQKLILEDLIKSPKKLSQLEIIYSDKSGFYRSIAYLKNNNYIYKDDEDYYHITRKGINRVLWQ